MMVPLYESLALLPALAGGTWLALRRRDPFAALLLWWSAGPLLALAAAGEKMPWRTVHLALPLVLLAAHVAGRAAGPARERLRTGAGPLLGWAGAGVALAAVALALAVTLRAGAGLLAHHPDTPVEPLIYTQT